MKFLVDAQLPRRIARRLWEAGHDALHTLDLPDANRTPDDTIIQIADRQERVVVTKDADFVVSFTLHGQPQRLLLISTGNIANADLEALLLPSLPAIAAAFEQAFLVEITRDALIIHA